MGGLLKVVLPLALMQLVYAVNSIWDRFLLSRSGTASLQASLSATMISVMFVCLISSTIGYTSVFIAQLHGGKDARGAVSAFAQGVWLSIASIPLLILLTIAACFLVDIAKHAPEVAQLEKAYIAIYVPGGFFMILNAVLSGMLTGQGRTVWVSACGIIGVLVNIAINPVFISGMGPVPAMGNAGAAIAGVISQVAMTLLLGIALMRDPLIRDYWRNAFFKSNFPLMRNILCSGFFNGVTSFASCVAFTVFTLILGRYSALEVGAANVVFAVNNVFYCTMCAISEGVCIVSGRNFGSGNKVAIRKTLGSGLLFFAIVLCAVFSIVLVCNNSIAEIFYPVDAPFEKQVWCDVVSMLFFIMLIREIGEGIGMVFEGVLRGIGDVKFVMFAKLSCDICFWMPLVLCVAKFGFSLTVLWWTMPVFFTLLTLVLAVRIKYIRRTLFP